MRIAIVFETVEQRRIGRGPDLRGAELAVRRTFHLTAQLRGHGLHAVADAEYRHAHREHFARRLRTLGVVNGFRTAGQDDGLGSEAFDVGGRRIAGVDFGIDAELAHAARDQLRVLGAEIENQDPVRMDVWHQPIR